MNLRRSVLVAVSVSAASLVFYMVVFGVKPSDIVSIGYEGFIIGGTLAFVRLIEQGTKFHLLVRQLDSTHPIRIQKSILVRMASEFVTLVTPIYLGGAVLRVAWLSKQGVKTGQAAWVVYLEELFDVVAGTTIAIIASLYLFRSGAFPIGVVVLLISSAILFTHLLIAVLSFKKRIRLPIFVFNLIRRFAGGKKAEVVEEFAKRTNDAYGEAASSFVGSMSSASFLGISVLTAVGVVIAGSISWVIGLSAGSPVGLFSSVLSVHVASVIGSLPITIGGSGLAELGIGLFTLNTSSGMAWRSIIAWRIVSYYVPIAFSSIALVLTVNREF